jgi:two-component system, cell cycle response regulator DivK
VTKILLVDDNPDIRRTLQVLITWMGFETITAANGKEAVERSLAEKPDLILMDFVMPAMDGGEATRILRLSPNTKDIPILAMTALYRRFELQRCIDIGCNDYIVKPFPLNELQRKIKALIP